MNIVSLKVKEEGTKPVGEANPTIGQIDKIEYVDEVKIEFMIDAYQKSRAEQLIKQYHPYETPVFDFIEIKQTSFMDLALWQKWIIK